MHHLHNIVSGKVTVDRVGDKVAYGAFKSGFIAVGSSDPLFDSGVDGGHVFVQTPVEAVVEHRPGPSETRLEPHSAGITSWIRISILSVRETMGI